MTSDFNTLRHSDAEVVELDVFERTDQLSFIRDYARLRRVAPSAMLAHVICRVAAAIPPTETLPPIVGGRASLNYLVAIVGRSGAGKGATAAASFETVHLVDDDRNPVSTPIVPFGSGEGIAATYRPRGKDEPELHSAIFDAPEVDSLVALGARSGSTLLPTLRAAWTGEQLGAGNASTDTRTIVPANSYRFVALLGVQPLKAGPLLDDHAGGTTQRILWASTADPAAPDVPGEYFDPELTIRLPRFKGEGFEVHDSIRKAIDRARLAELRDPDSVDPLDGHRRLIQLKTAAVLAVMQHRMFITPDDWTTAGLIVRESIRTREGIRSTIAARRAQAKRAEAASNAEANVHAADKADEALLQRAKQAVARYVEKHHEGTRSAVHRTIRYDLRPYLNRAIDALEDERTLYVGRDEAGNITNVSIWGNNDGA